MFLGAMIEPALVAGIDEPVARKRELQAVVDALHSRQAGEFDETGMEKRAEIENPVDAVCTRKPGFRIGDGVDDLAQGLRGSPAVHDPGRHLVGSQPLDMLAKADEFEKLLAV
jgi:hypothetical protein